MSHFMKTRIALALSILLSAPLALAEETWDCFASQFATSGEPLVVAAIGDDKESGEIHVAGTVHRATYRVVGFKRRWDFGLQPDNTFDYAFIIEPNGQSRYYDFSSVEAGEPKTESMTFFCKKR
jgi:hypothetical protein